jgi:hypothetical protein
MPGLSPISDLIRGRKKIKQGLRTAQLQEKCPRCNEK